MEVPLKKIYLRSLLLFSNLLKSILWENLLFWEVGKVVLVPAILAQSKGFEVFLSDSSQLLDKYKNILTERNIDFEEGVHSEAKILDAELVIKSPGIPDKVPLIVALKQKGVQGYFRD